jgi:hypothetical protein
VVVVAPGVWDAHTMETRGQIATRHAEAVVRSRVYDLRLVSQVYTS